MKKPKGIAFDLEGTLLPTDYARHGAWLKIAKELDIILLFDEALEQIPGWIGGGDRKVAEWFHRQTGVPMDELLARVLAWFWKLIEHDPPKPRAGSLEFIERIKRASLPFALGSLTPREDGKRLLKLSGLDIVFTNRPVIFLEDVGEENKKPKPDVYLATAARMGIAPKEQIVFEDSPTGIQAAVTAKSVAYAVPMYTDKPALSEQLKNAGATEVFYSWWDVNVLSN